MDEIPQRIFKHWIHSREEDTENIKVYRPIDYHFPPSRGREGLEFKRNNEFTRYDIAPTDGSIGVNGKWEFEGMNVVQIYFDNQKNQPYTVRIISCDDNVLKLIYG